MLTITLLKALILIIPILISVAFITLAERKILRLTGKRQGPNKVSIQGLLQPIADAAKLANKNSNQLSNFAIFIYYFSVITIFVTSIILWSCLNISPTVINWKFSFIIIIMILGVIAIKRILAGWRTFRKYSIVGRMRTVSQIISYESVIYICLLGLIWISKNFRIKRIIRQEYYLLCVVVPVILYFWLPSIIAELRRTPYDFSEGERELVRGFNTEFGSKGFTMIFLREYRNIIFFIRLTLTLYLIQEKRLTSILTLVVLIFWIIWIRRTLPRIRFDKFIIKAWKFYIPCITLILITIVLII